MMLKIYSSDSFYSNSLNSISVNMRRRIRFSQKVFLLIRWIILYHFRIAVHSITERMKSNLIRNYTVLINTVFTDCAWKHHMCEIICQYQVLGSVIHIAAVKISGLKTFKHLVMCLHVSDLVVWRHIKAVSYTHLFRKRWFKNWKHAIKNYM